VIERTVHISKNFGQADEHDRQQHQKLSPSERQKAAAYLKKKIFGSNVKDVRACHRN